jgi:two-component system sensor histidine kinase SenX3
VFERVVTRYVKRAESAGLSLVTIAPRELAVRGDAPLLERALNNLVDNAIKYAGGRGRIELSASSTEDERVTLSVADEGVGIPREEQGKLFERFYRGAAGRRSARGSGLGLAIVAAIVEGHGGEIELEGQPGVGTTVRLVLPAAQGIPSEDSRELAALERDLGEPLRRG